MDVQIKVNRMIEYRQGSKPSITFADDSRDTMLTILESDWNIAGKPEQIVLTIPENVEKETTKS